MRRLRLVAAVLALPVAAAGAAAAHPSDQARQVGPSAYQAAARAPPGSGSIAPRRTALGIAAGVARGGP